MNEFQLIKHYFSQCGPTHAQVAVTIGDDCALINPTQEQSIAVSVDTLVENVHFLPSMDPVALGYKALAVNLSDLAAMGAKPLWMTLALTLPEVDQIWLSGFSQGLIEAANKYNISLVGGDTTRGPKSITITVNGQVQQELALLRSTALDGDWIYVTGTLGDSAFGLRLLQTSAGINSQQEAYLINRHQRPTPRLAEGQNILGLATSAIDLSDGLVSDIQHILNASNVGAIIWVEQLPLSNELNAMVDKQTAISYALTGGEDYELLFTVPETKRQQLEINLKQIGTPFSKIGQINNSNKLQLLENGFPFTPTNLGFEHFQ